MAKSMVVTCAGVSSKPIEVGNGIGLTFGEKKVVVGAGRGRAALLRKKGVRGGGGLVAGVGE